MNKEILNKVDEIKEFIEKTSEYQKFLSLRKDMEKNKELMMIIHEIKTLQKDVVHHYDKKDKLKKKLDELNNYPLYQEYCNAKDEINNMYNIIENRLNKFFNEKIN